MRKYVVICCALIVLNGTIGCYPFKGFVVESGSKGDHRKYRDFDFFLTPSEIRNETIEKVLLSRLGLQGYQISADSPDFMISYRLFLGSPNYYGVNLIKNRNYKKKLDLIADHLNNDLKQMSVLILFSDFTTGEVVFQCHISGIYCNPYKANDVRLITAVHKAFDQYKNFSPKNDRRFFDRKYAVVKEHISHR
jgi:hypothetical protein